MSWMSTLVKTYDNLIANDSFIEENNFPAVSIIAHITAKAQIEIVIDDEGCFKEAKVVDKKNCEIIIPTTEDSASRAADIAPHPLCDTLSYLAGDYSLYATNKKDAEKSAEKFEKYIAQLKKWAEFENAPVKVKAIYKYLEKKTVIANLVENKVVELDENLKFSSKKINGNTYEKSLVRFRVLCDDNSETACWSDKTLFNSYIEYYLSERTSEKDKCYESGIETPICTKHPKGIVASSYGAKLISSNDQSNFTYRGRFAKSQEACTIGYEATQKAHIALSWLAKTQGYTVGTKEKRTYVCWCPEAKKVESPLNSLWGDDKEEVSYNSHVEYKNEMEKLFAGKKANFSESDTIVLISLDAATTGRLSITYYNELGAKDFLNRMEQWSDSCQWYFKKKNPEGKFVDSVKTPHTIRIIVCAFGEERGNFIELDSRILKEQVQRIVHCIADRQPIPYDIVHALFVKASNPQKYQKWYNYEEVLSTACALIAKYHSDYDKEVKYTMELDKSKTDRSYLFGRLLAVAELIEARTYYNKPDTAARITNATKLQPAFVNHPLHTWKLIEDKLNPYYKQSGPSKEDYYKKLISEIVTLFETDDIDKLNLPLDEGYLIGYYLQRKEMNTKSKEEK